MKLSFNASILTIYFLLATLSSSKSLDGDLYFETDVRPILKAQCFHCHGEEDEKEADLDLRLVRLMQDGGKSGRAITPSDIENSILWEKISSDEMPEGDKKLSPTQKNVIKNWILQGAKTLRPEPENVADARFTKEELEHWAFQPLNTIKKSEEEIITVDTFIQKKLNDKGLHLSKQTSKEKLIRRISYDLTGLPPTRQMLDQLLDNQAGFYEAFVDKLLSSPNFGIRWARHWLDTAGFAETEGFDLNDSKRPHAWRYRDYVINSFNNNKRIDRFIIEQLAGDELIKEPYDKSNPSHLELLSATGFLRMAPDSTQRVNNITERNNAVSNMIQVVGNSILGLTVNCAQCHDHKYDPISIDDYYSFRSIFDPAFPLKTWKKPSERLIDMTDSKIMEERAAIEAEAKALEDDMISRRNAHCKTIQNLKLDSVPEVDREETRVAVLKDPKDHTQREKDLLLKYPMVKPVNFIVGLLVEYDGKAFADFKKEQDKIAKIRSTKPPLTLIRATTEPGDTLPVSRILFRGNPESPKDPVKPSELTALKQHRQIPSLNENDPNLKSSGRRLNYAKQLTNGNHPMTARVFVNRVWMHLLGRGIVAGNGDFGIAGEKPSHVELLDWLADEFVKDGWNLKNLIRKIVVSKTYKQSSKRNENLEAIDPDNILLGRANMKRLEAEAIRDSLLLVSGTLNETHSGPSVPVSANNEGKATLQTESGRRSIFVEVQRRLPLNMLATFDQPEMTPNCNVRKNTTISSQALWFMNDDESLKLAKTLAQSIIKHSKDPKIQIEELFFRLFTQKPREIDFSECMNFLNSQSKIFVERDDSADHQLLAMASLCQVLFASNKFLFID